MQKFLKTFLIVGSIGCYLSTAEAFNWFKPKQTEYGQDQDGVAGDSGSSSQSSGNRSGDSASIKKVYVSKSGSRSGDSGGSRSGDASDFQASTTTKTQSPLMKAYNNSGTFKPNSMQTSGTYGMHRGSFNCSSLSKICADAPKNCEKVKKTIPNGEALDYTLQYLSDNYEQMQDTSCLSGSTHGNSVKKGFSNASNGKGKFILNDTDSRLGNGRAQAHYVDLCQGEYHTYGVKMGTGQTFLDVVNKHSTLTGAFMSGQQKIRFEPTKSSKPGYRKAGLNDPYQVELVGLNSSNAQTDDSKPMHESPFNTSWGCPSIDRSSSDILNKIKGGNLVMNYRRGYMQRLGKNASCKNGRGAGSGYSSESVSQGGTQ